MSVKKPTILEQRIVAESRLFKVEAVDLCFANGAQRTYERMKGSGRGAVMLVPVDEQQQLLLVREYAVGTERYELGFPKGLIDPGEVPEVAANRELKEEVGYGANELTPLKSICLAPSYFNSMMHIFIAKALYPEMLQGDEPEPLEVVRWPLAHADELLLQPDFQEARSVCALMLAQQFFLKNGF